MKPEYPHPGMPAGVENADLLMQFLACDAALVRARLLPVLADPDADWEQVCNVSRIAVRRGRVRIYDALAETAGGDAGRCCTLSAAEMAGLLRQ